MKRIMSLIVLSTTVFMSLSAFAETLDCESDTVRIIGQIQTRYLRMGHSKFYGDLDIFIYDHRKIVGSATVTVLDGDI